jgi:hypothetical protein
MTGYDRTLRKKWESKTKLKRKCKRNRRGYVKKMKEQLGESRMRKK